MQSNNKQFTKMETEVYEDLTQLYRHFKRQIQLYITQFKNHQTVPFYNQQFDQEIQIIRKTQYMIIQKYESKKQYVSIFKTIFSRFFCRLIELTQNQNHKLNNNDQSSLLRPFLNELQSIIYNANSVDAYLQTLQNTFEHFKVFYKKHTVILNNQESVEVIELSPNKNPPIFSHTQQVLIKYPNKISKLSQTFILHNCLQLDYRSFQSTFYLSQSNKDEFYKLMFTKNKQIQSQIQTYYKNYSSYLLRKNKKKILMNINFKPLQSNFLDTDSSYKGFYSTNKRQKGITLKYEPRLITDLNEYGNDNYNDHYQFQNPNQQELKKIKLKNTNYSSKNFSIRTTNKITMLLSTRKTYNNYNNNKFTIQDNFRSGTGIGTSNSSGKPKINLQTKKIFLDFNKLPLESFNSINNNNNYHHQLKHQNILRERRKYKNQHNSSRKKTLKQSFQCTIEGRHLTDIKHTDSDISLLRSGISVFSKKGIF